MNLQVQLPSVLTCCGIPQLLRVLRLYRQSKLLGPVSLREKNTAHCLDFQRKAGMWPRSAQDRNHRFQRLCHRSLSAGTLPWLSGCTVAASLAWGSDRDKAASITITVRIVAVSATANNRLNQNAEAAVTQKPVQNHKHNSQKHHKHLDRMLSETLLLITSHNDDCTASARRRRPDDGRNLN